MPKKIPKSERRTLEQLTEHYTIEKGLADRLRNAGKKERRYLYTAVYDELYRRVPHHPQLTRKVDPNAVTRKVTRQIRLLKRFLNPKVTFLEVGPGDCTLAFEVAKFVKKVYAMDVSEHITESSETPINFELIISDGTCIPIPDNNVNVAYSNQLMEHLHPDDALEQLRNIYETLTTGGVYVCITPNRLTGPHDISKYFDEAARGLHLKEYTVTELVRIFKAVGFSKVSVLISARGFTLLLPLFQVKWIQGMLVRLPRTISRRIACWLPIRLLLGITLVARK
jgi:SAM-dependent methyltransferase